MAATKRVMATKVKIEDNYTPADMKEKQEVGTNTSESDISMCTAVKRKRGRPRKEEAKTTTPSDRPSSQPRSKTPTTPSDRPSSQPTIKTPDSEADDGVTHSPSPRKRGRPSLGTKTTEDNDTKSPTPRKRGRPSLASLQGNKTKSVGVQMSNQPRKRGRPLGSTNKNKANDVMQYKKKYMKKEKYRLLAKQFKLRRENIKNGPIKTFLTVKPVNRESSDDNSKSPVYNVMPQRKNNVQTPRLTEYQRSLLHVNHSKIYMNYETDNEPALDVLQKKLLAVNTQLIDTEEQKLELEKRIIIFKQRKIELERELLNYQPKRRVLTRVEQIPVVDLTNKVHNGIHQGAKIEGWMALPESVIKACVASSSSSSSPSNVKSSQVDPNDQKAKNMTSKN
ncbi:serine/arginine repetitive matrix protein 2-like isoform X2 [Argopecten irradians]|uniref:serine/arginine repetitive matrix protein 2-like isoform X2 n=1 Tax=Argopecten irradians TaxID=31199 RepID=UPI0037227078